MRGADVIEANSDEAANLIREGVIGEQQIDFCDGTGRSNFDVRRFPFREEAVSPRLGLCEEALTRLLFLGGLAGIELELAFCHG